MLCCSLVETWAMMNILLTSLQVCYKLHWELISPTLTLLILQASNDLLVCLNYLLHLSILTLFLQTNLLHSFLFCPTISFSQASLSTFHYQAFFLSIFIYSIIFYLNVHWTTGLAVLMCVFSDIEGYQNGWNTRLKCKNSSENKWYVNDVLEVIKKHAVNGLTLHLNSFDDVEYHVHRRRRKDQRLCFLNSLFVRKAEVMSSYWFIERWHVQTNTCISALSPFSTAEVKYH